MKGNAIMSDVKLSYEELKCLESHFRQIQRDAVVCTLNHSVVEKVALLNKIVSQFRSANQLESSDKIEP
jgi:hypothetical protein